VSSLMTSLTENAVPALDFRPPGNITATLIVVRRRKVIGQFYSHATPRCVKNSAAIRKTGSKLTLLGSNPRNNSSEDLFADTKPSSFRLPTTMKVSLYDQVSITFD
jgi:hypothetical protein